MSDHGLIDLSATSRVGSYGVGRFISLEQRLFTTVCELCSVPTVMSLEVTKSSSSTTAHHTSLI